MPRTLGDLTIREVPLLGTDQDVGSAVQDIIAAEVPALPVVDGGGRYRGIFGEREFITALFPGYVGSLRHAGFVSKSIDTVIEKRQTCRIEPVGDHMNTEHVDVPPDFADLQLAEVFLHHRVLIVPVIQDGRVAGVITRWDFFKALVERTLANQL